MTEAQLATHQVVHSINTTRLPVAFATVNDPDVSLLTMAKKRIAKGESNLFITVVHEAQHGRIRTRHMEWLIPAE